MKILILFLSLINIISCQQNLIDFFSRLATRDMVFKDYKNAPDFLPTYGSFSSKVFGRPDMKTGQRVADWSPETHDMNPEELGSYVAGDILIPNNTAAAATTGRNGLVAESSRWPGGVIPFVISGKFNQEDIELIYHAFDIYHDLTCITFVPWSGFEPHYISIENSQTGCWASVGRTGGKQVVNLQSPGCLTKIGTPLHELMHTVGFLHEQNRFERDAHVDILWNNIAKGKEENFKKAPRTMAMSEVPYDYNSVMHYTLVAFSSNGAPTINTKIGGVSVGQREGLSRRDVQKIRLMYKCEGRISHVSQH